MGPSWHVKLLLIYGAIFLNGWWILALLFILHDVKLLGIWPNFAHGRRCVPNDLLDMYLLTQ